jgi:tetratricopeptide (TPR) repeat protein
MQENKKAIRAFQKSISLDYNQIEAYIIMGITCHDLKNYADAMRCYRKAMDINPHYAAPYLMAGTACFSLHKFEEAVQNYEKALNFVTGNNYGTIYHHIGRANFCLKKYNEAIFYYKKAMEINPDNSEIYQDMMFLYHKLANKAAEIKYGKKTAELGSEIAEKWMENNGIEG